VGKAKLKHKIYLSDF
jgi:hypothetical protein